MKHLIALGGAVGAAVSAGVVLAITLPIMGVGEPLHEVIAAVATVVVAGVVYRSIVVAMEEPSSQEKGQEPK